ncbi:MAG TPA: hypothetical protein VGI13_10900 [Candidatus Acidoferrum sp.]|jgi:hypothetical protein
MEYNKTLGRLGVSLGAFLLVFSGWAYAQSNASPGNVTFTVTAVGKKEAPPAISKDDVQVSFGKERKQIADWKKGDKLFLAILIDDSLDSTAAGNWQYLKEFIMAQPASTLIAVGYMKNNTAMIAQDFTDNHELAAKALRIPMGLGAIGSSPYLSMIDMLKRWPQTNARQSILVITSGIDYFRGSGFGPLYPDLQPLIDRAQRQNTNIWSVYYPSSGHRGRGMFRLNNAQTNIDKLSEDTGAESYFLGFGEPVSLKPYFDEIGQHLNNQYLVTVAGAAGGKGKYQNVKVKTEIPEVELIAPAAVYIPGTSAGR